MLINMKIRGPGDTCCTVSNGQKCQYSNSKSRSVRRWANAWVHGTNNRNTNRHVTHSAYGPPPSSYFSSAMAFVVVCLEGCVDLVSRLRMSRKSSQLPLPPAELTGQARPS